MNFFSYLRLLFPVLMLFSYTSYAAFTISPTHGQIFVSKKHKKNPNTSFYVENNENESIAIDASLKKRTHFKDGTFLDEQPKDLNSKIEIFPKQFILKPKEKRLIKVIYKGPKNIEIEENYRIIVQRLVVQLNKDLTEKKVNSKLNLIVQFHGHIFVTPEDGKPNIKLINYRKNHFVSADKKVESDGISLTFENTGTASAPLEKYEATVTYIDENGVEKKKVLKQEDVPPKTTLFMESRGRVFVKSIKSLFLPFSEKIKEIKNVDVTLNQ